ncbi:hypothetical protein Tco_1530127, partial [Tanacetum coccineum]
MQVQLILGQVRHLSSCTTANGIGHIARTALNPGVHITLNTQIQEVVCRFKLKRTGLALEEEQFICIFIGQDNAIDEDVMSNLVSATLALNVDNVFQADDCDAFDFDVDEAPTAQTMFMANLSSADPVYDKAGPLIFGRTKTFYLSNVSSVPNNAYTMIINEMHEQTAQSISANKQNKVVNASLTAELATYKEQVELYERWAKFELTEREQKIEEQLRIVITDHNIKEENLKKELHSVKMQLTSTINHNKSMVEEVTSLKKDFKQKENKYLEEFLDMKALKKFTCCVNQSPIMMNRK